MNNKILFFITLILQLQAYGIPTSPFAKITVQKNDSKPKFVPRRMTDTEKNRLTTYIVTQLAKAKKNNDHLKIESYELLGSLLEKLDTESLNLNDPKNEKAYTDYFKLVVAELESLGQNPQEILQTTGLRQKLLEGTLERAPWFIKEIEGLAWFFEQDAKLAAFNAQRVQSGLEPFGPIKPQWPTAKDKVIYVISLADQIDRNHQRVDTADLTSIIETIDDYLVHFSSDVPNVFKRTINQARNKLEKIRNIRGIPAPNK